MVDEEPPPPARQHRLFRLVFDTLPRFLIGSLIIVAVLVNFANVIGRYVFSRSIYWTEEILVFLLLWAVFIGMVAVTYNGAHLNMDLLLRRLSGRLRRLVNGAIALTLIACALVVVVQSVKVVSVLARTGQVSVAAGVPLVVPHAAILVGFALAAVAAAVRFRAYLSGRFD